MKSVVQSKSMNFAPPSLNIFLHETLQIHLMVVQTLKVSFFVVGNEFGNVLDMYRPGDEIL